MSDFSKSKLFVVDDNTIVLADQPAIGLQGDRFAPGILVDSKYEVLGLLGEGGMGVVYKVRHVLLDKVVALKTFKSVNLSDESCLRFQREANAIARINQESVIQVFDFGLTENGFPYYTMEYLQGQSLAEKLAAEGPLSIEQAIELFVPVCQGLSVAHSKGIVHRDLKPSNILLVTTASRAKVKILDFGIASLNLTAVAGQKLTAIGTIVGSPLYMSPEQSLGQNITEHADIYSLGCALFEMVVGKPPFLGKTAIETVMMHHNCPLPTMKQASGGKDFSQAFEKLVSRMLAKSCRDRQSSMLEVANDLLALTSHPRNSADTTVVSRKAPIEPAAHASEDSAGNGRGSQTYSPQDDSTANTDTGIGIGTGELKRQSQSSVSSRLTSRFVVVAASISLLAALAVSSFVYKLAVPKLATPKPTTTEPSASIVPGLRRSQIVKDVDGKEYLVFSFPEVQEYGTFYGSTPPGLDVAAKGTVKFLANQEIIFQPSSFFLQDIANFDVFLPEQVMGLDFAKAHLRADAKVAVLKRVGQLSNLWMLNLESSYVDDADLDVLSKLKHLKRLNLNYTNVHGSALAKYAQVRELDRLDFSGCPDATNLLLALKGCKLTQLFLENSSLTPRDFISIGEISNLHGLHVDGSGMRSSDLDSLCPLKLLNLLGCIELELSRESLIVLRQMSKNSLRWLYVSDANLSAAEKTAIRQIIPAVSFPDYSKGVRQTMEAEGFGDIYKDSSQK